MRLFVVGHEASDSTLLSFRRQFLNYLSISPSSDDDPCLAMRPPNRF
jgi:hypothetical protein